MWPLQGIPLHRCVADFFSRCQLGIRVTVGQFGCDSNCRVADQPSGIIDATNCESSRLYSSGVRSNEGWQSRLDKAIQDVYTSTMRAKAFEDEPAAALFDVPCACQNLRRATRVVTRIYDQELRRTGLEITQFGLLTALAKMGEANQKRLSAGFAMDSTTLTRTLGLLRKQGWIRARRGKDRRERPFNPYPAGQRQIALDPPPQRRAET